MKCKNTIHSEYTYEFYLNLVCTKKKHDQKVSSKDILNVYVTLMKDETIDGKIPTHEVVANKYDQYSTI